MTLAERQLSQEAVLVGAHVEDCRTYVRVTYHDVWPSAAESLRVRQAAIASGHWHAAGRALFDLRTVQVASAPHYDVASERVDAGRRSPMTRRALRC